MSEQSYKIQRKGRSIAAELSIHKSGKQTENTVAEPVGKKRPCGDRHRTTEPGEDRIVQRRKEYRCGRWKYTKANFAELRKFCGKKIWKELFED